MDKANDSRVAQNNMPPSRTQVRLLAVILLFGFLLRVSTILWGAGGLELNVVPFQTRPDVIIVSSNSYDAMDRALRSPKLKNWTWDPNDKAEWYGYVAPSPEVFRFFDELIRETGEYHLETNLEVPGGDYVTVDFAHLGVRIYRRTATKAHP